MKKIMYFLSGMIVAASFSTFAYAASFTDQSHFSDWYKNSLERMANLGVVSGYSDGSFKPEQGVNRAELVVMLDRLEKKISENKTASLDESRVENLFQKALTSYDELSSLNIDRFYKIMVVMAEAGMRKLESEPNLEGYEKVTDIDLPEGYTLYRKPNIVFSYYLNYKGERLIGGDALGQVDEWFGTFSVI